MPSNSLLPDRAFKIPDILKAAVIWDIALFQFLFLTQGCHFFTYLHPSYQSVSSVIFPVVKL